MPRPLPWLKGNNAESKSPQIPPPKRRRLSPTVASSDDELPTASDLRAPARRLDAQIPRSPSTSPAPAPPETHLMRPGDDAWRIVEDEFEATAKLYTLHVHNAEYLRQKALARERESRFGREIARPVVGGLSKEAERHMAVERQRRATLMEVAEEETEDPWVGTHLAGLMMGKKKSVKLKAREAGDGRSHTRAAAGFDSARGGTVATLLKKETTHMETTDDDDLDAPVKTQIKVRMEKHTQRQPLPSRRTELRSESSDISPPSRRKETIRNKTNSRPTELRSASSDILPPTRNPPQNPTSKSEPSSNRGEVTHHARTKERVPNPETQHDPFEEEIGTGFPSIPLLTKRAGSSVLARRREARLRREKEEKEREMAELKASSMHELPTFLF